MLLMRAAGRKVRDAAILLCFVLALFFGAGQAGAKTEVACIGDSITLGVGSDGGRDYPEYLQELLGEEYQVYNYGVKGRAILPDSRHPYQRESCYQTSREQKADLYLIMFGSNDIWEESWDKDIFGQELERFVRSYQEVSEHTCVYLIKPPEYFPKEGDVQGQQKKLLMQDLYESIDEAAQTTGCGVIDLYSLTKDHPGWFADEVHPNAQGYEKIAEYIYQCVFAENGVNGTED